ncbi:MAG: hypothetical protein ACI8XO_005060 [Verrucomicrobiales bacterium]|jgi:hypothetical protein
MMVVPLPVIVLDVIADEEPQVAFTPNASCCLYN